MSRRRGTEDALASQIATALAVVDRQLGIPIPDRFPRGDGGGPKGTRTLAHDFLNWARRVRVFELVQIPKTVLDQLTPGFREMLDEKRLDGGEPTFWLTNLGHAEQPEPPAPGMLPPPMSADDRAKNALFMRLVRKDWLAAQAGVDAAVREAAEAIAERRRARTKGMSAAAAAAAAAEAAEEVDGGGGLEGAGGPAPGSALWHAMTRAGSEQLRRWADEDERSAQEAAEAERLGKARRGKAAHSGWVARTSAREVQLPTAREWEAARLAEVARSKGISVGAARALEAGRPRPPLRNTAELALDGNAAPAAGARAVHALSDLTEARESLAERGFVFESNYRDEEDGEMGEEGAEALEAAREKARAAAWRVYQDERGEASRAAFRSWSARKDAAAEAVRALAALPLAPDMPARAAVVASARAGAAGGRRGGTPLAEAAAQLTAPPARCDAVREALGAPGSAATADGRFLPVREVRASDAERWRGVGRVLAAMDPASLLRPWTAWSAPLFSSSECTSEWPGLCEEARRAAEAEAGGDGAEGGGKTEEGGGTAAAAAAAGPEADAARADAALGALRAAAAPHLEMARGVSARLSGRPPSQPELTKGATGLDPAPAGDAAPEVVEMPSRGGGRGRGGAWVTVRWTDGADPSTSPAAFFVIEAREAAGGRATGSSSSWRRVVVDPPPPATADADALPAALGCTVTRLRPGRAYTVRARAINAFGASPFAFLHLAARPEPPAPPVAVRRGSRMLGLSWAADDVEAFAWRRLRDTFRSVAAGPPAPAEPDGRAPDADDECATANPAALAAAVAADPALTRLLRRGRAPGASGRAGTSLDALRRATDPVTWDDVTALSPAAAPPSDGTAAPSPRGGMTFASATSGRPATASSRRAGGVRASADLSATMGLASARASLARRSLQGPLTATAPPSTRGDGPDRPSTARRHARGPKLTYELWTLDAGDADTLQSAGGAGLASPGGVGWALAFTGRGTAHRLTDLRPASAYLVAVRARNEDGDVSAFGPVATVRTRLDRPSPPALASPALATSLRVRWGTVSPAAEGGAAAAVSSATPASASHARAAAVEWAMGGERPSGGRAADAAIAMAAFDRLATAPPAGRSVATSRSTSGASTPGSSAGPSRRTARETRPPPDDIPMDEDEDEDSWSVASSGAGGGSGAAAGRKPSGARPSHTPDSGSVAEPPAGRPLLPWALAPALLSALGVRPTAASLAGLARCAAAGGRDGGDADDGRGVVVTEEAVQAWLGQRSRVTYSLEVRAGPRGSAWAPVGSGTDAEADVTGLAPRVSHRVRVRAEAGASSSSWAVSGALWTAPMAPFAPAVVRCTPRSATLRWHAAQGGAAGFVVMGAVVDRLGPRADGPAAAAEPELEWHPLLQTSSELAVRPRQEPPTTATEHPVPPHSPLPRCPPPADRRRPKPLHGVSILRRGPRRRRRRGERPVPRRPGRDARCRRLVGALGRPRHGSLRGGDRRPRRAGGQVLLQAARVVQGEPPRQSLWRGRAR